MTRVSLKEAYDNKDVVAQIYAIRDIAEGASDTADSAKTTADDAKTYVDTLGVQVEGAVQTANNASASAQTSAQTVAGYDARLTEVEGDLNAVTLRVTTAEGQIVTIQGRVTALETADGQNVKLTGEHAIGNYAVLLTGNQDNILGRKRIPEFDRLESIISGNTNVFNSAYEIDVDQNAIYCVFEIFDRSDQSYGVYGSVMRAYGITLEKLYGNMSENRVAVALSADRTKMYIFVYSNRANLDIRYCVHAWDPNHIANVVRVDNTRSETTETLVAGSTYYAVIKI